MKASKPYFSHDIATKSDEKIIRLMFDFRKNKKDFSEYKLQELVPHAAYAIYWEIIEYLHENTLKVDELEMLSDVLRVDIEILEKILNNYDLFKIKDSAYISERVLRNLKLQEEKSEKARQSANKRHKGKKEEKQLPEYDEELVLSIIQIFNKEFKKSQIVSKENKAKIFKIHIENKLSIEVWKTIFSNAKRGWDINDKKNVKPTLQLILEKWDSFASDDYFLAPDREAAAIRENEIKLQEEKEKAENAKKAEIYQQQKENEYNSICDKKSALEYLFKYCPIKQQDFLVRHSQFKELSEKYSFSTKEALNYFEHKGEPNG